MGGSLFSKEPPKKLTVESSAEYSVEGPNTPVQNDEKKSLFKPVAKQPPKEPEDAGDGLLFGAVEVSDAR